MADFCLGSLILHIIIAKNIKIYKITFEMNVSYMIIDNIVHTLVTSLIKVHLIYEKYMFIIVIFRFNFN